MKKQSFTLALLFIAALATAQHPKNGNFENWSTVLPDHWQYVQGFVNQDNPYLGTFSVSLSSKDDSLGFFKGGTIRQIDTVPFRPFSLTGFRKGIGAVTIHVFDASGNEVGSVRRAFNHVPWQYFEDTIQYTTSPRSQYVVNIELENMPITGPTSANFDTLSFREDLFLGLTDPAVANSPRLYPNPTTSEFKYRWPEVGNIMVFDFNGQLLIQHPTDRTDGTIDVSRYRGRMLLVAFRKGNEVYGVETLVVQ